MTQDPALVAYNSYHELMQALKSLCVQRSTGTMFIATPDNHFGRIVLKGGEIISLIFGTKSGESAIPFIRAIKAGKFKFSQGHAQADTSENLPPSPVLLTRLSAGVASSGPATHTAINKNMLGQIYRVVEGELVEFVGPIASLVCSEHKEKFGAITQAGELSVMLESIAREIGDAGKARHFMERVWERLSP